MTPDQLKNQHLLWRAGFGPVAEEYHQLATAGTSGYVNALFKASAKAPTYIDIAGTPLQGLTTGIIELSKQSKKELTPEKRKQLRAQSRQQIRSLNLAWLDEMVNSDQQLREKMSLFWHGHFATRNINILYQQQLLGVIRRNALGSFADMLQEVSKSASMINFLNNNQNRKDHPNENFAREVMELFTLGRGHYSENDVKEAARAFTGWGTNIQGEFVFRKFQHDDGQKTVFGKKGNFDGDDLLQLLLEQKQTALYITGKIYRFFVNETVDEQRVKLLAEKFFQSNYNIGSLMKEIFSSEWFYDTKNIGCRIKSPVELLAGIQRVLPMKVENKAIFLLMQNLLGQLLFYPPNVAGWPGGKNWIDSSSLMLRLRIPSLLMDTQELSMSPKNDDDQMMGISEEMNKKPYGQKQLIKADIEWEKYIPKFSKVPREELLSSISKLLLQTPASNSTGAIEKYIDASSRENFIRSATIRLMSTPEYQLC
jgi:uncharacterized protein (DUF1800 family)